MNMLATARRLLADTSHIVTETGERIPTTPPTDFTRHGGSDRLAELMNNLRQSSEVDAADIATNIANAARINTMNDERPVQSVAETLSAQMLEYAEKVRAAITTIENEQKLADDVHSDALAALRQEIENREQAHKELTAANADRIADHKRALAGIDALRDTIHPPRPTSEKPTNVARIGKGRGETVSGENT